MTSIHETAIVDSGAELGEHCRVWHWVHICSGAKIGSNVSLGQNVFVGNKVVIGDRCKVQNNVSVYDNVTLEEGVFCGPSMVFTNVYNPRALIERKDEYRNTLVKKGATLGANCTIVCGVTVGRYAFVGAGSVVNKDVPDYSLMVGVPAKQIGWMSEHGEKLELPVVGDGLATCSHSGTTYTLKNSQLSVETPDQEAATTYQLPEEVIEMTKSADEKLDAVRNAPLPADEDLPSISKKKLDRIEAFASHDGVRGLR